MSGAWVPPWDRKPAAEISFTLPSGTQCAEHVDSIEMKQGSPRIAQDVEDYLAREHLMFRLSESDILAAAPDESGLTTVAADGTTSVTSTPVDPAALSDADYRAAAVHAGQRGAHRRSGRGRVRRGRRRRRRGLRLMRTPGRERASAAKVEAALHANADDLLAFGERRVGRDDAPDVLAEVMLVAWRRTADLPGDPAEARMWLFGVARGVVANALRGRLRRHQLADRVRTLAPTGPQPQGAPADQGLEVRDAIERLDPDLAEVVRLVHWDGFSLTDTARLLDAPPSTIRSRYAKTREQLATALLRAPSEST